MRARNWGCFQFLILGYMKLKLRTTDGLVIFFQFLILGYLFDQFVERNPLVWSFQFLILGYRNINYDTRISSQINLSIPHFRILAEALKDFQKGQSDFQFLILGYHIGGEPYSCGAMCLSIPHFRIQKEKRKKSWFYRLVLSIPHFRIPKRTA